MNTRTLYHAIDALIQTMWMFFTMGLVSALLFRGESFDWIPAALCYAVAFWSVRDANRAMSRLKTEINRDTVHGLNGPSRQGDLL